MAEHPEIVMTRDSGMRGYGIDISYRNGPAVTVFMGDNGAVFIVATKEGSEIDYEVDQQRSLELDTVYACGNEKPRAHFDPNDDSRAILVEDTW